MYYSKEELQRFANVAHTQLFMSLTHSEYYSWGISRIACSEIAGLPSLVLHVSALFHTGIVIISLNTAKDLYEVSLAVEQEGGTYRTTETKTDVYCDVLGRTIDQMIEHPIGMSEEEYHKRALSDSLAKIMAD